MKLFAFRMCGPKDRWGTKQDKAVKLHQGDMTWREDDWVAGRTMGTTEKEPICSIKESAWPLDAPPGTRWACPVSRVQGVKGLYDVRVIEGEAERLVQYRMVAVEEAEAELARRKAILQDHLESTFLAARIATPADCTKFLPGTSKATVIAGLKNQKPLSEQQVAGERRMVEDLTGIFR